MHWCVCVHESSLLSAILMLGFLSEQLKKNITKYSKIITL